MRSLQDVLAECETDELVGQRHTDLASVLRWYHTPGITVALIDGGELRETWSAGLREAGRSDPVTPRTLFQAGSISKSVAAAMTLRLVADGVLDLDEDVNERLRAWKLPANDGWQPGVTLRHLLSHTAGLTVHGFQGFPAGAPVPGLLDILDGRADTPPVRATTLPGLQFSYSGGGYVVLQRLLTDVTGTDFATLAATLVFTPVGMADSTYAQPLPATLADQAAVGHRVGPVPVAGRWHTYPQLAACGLWSTPADLARFFLALRDSRSGVPGGLLPRHLAEQMTTRYATNVPYGLGLELAQDGQPESIGHGGSVEGYRDEAVLYLAAGTGAVAMTNGDNGSALLTECVLPALGHAYGWPNPNVPHNSPAGDPIGLYRDGATMLRIGRAGDGLTLTTGDQPPVPLRSAPDGSWQADRLNLEVRFPEPGVLVLRQRARYTTDIRATRQ